MSIEAMKQALKNELSASDFIDKAPQSWDKTERTEWARLQAMLHNIRVFKKAMRQAIAEAEKQEPKCVVIVEVFGKDWRLEYMSLPVGRHKLYAQQYLYTTPQQRKPLTNENPLLVFAKECVLGAYSETDLANAAFRAIEAAHGIKE